MAYIGYGRCYGTLYLNTGLAGLSQPPGLLLALNAEDGRVLWQQTGIGSSWSEAVANEHITIIQDGRNLYAFFNTTTFTLTVLAMDEQTGQTRWQKQHVETFRVA